SSRPCASTATSCAPRASSGAPTRWPARAACASSRGAATWRSIRAATASASSCSSTGAAAGGAGMALKVADRGRVPPFIVMDVMRVANEREAAGGDVLHLEVGQPGTPAPDAVLAAARAALDGHLIGYTDAMGLPSLRRRIARHYAAWYGREI